MCIRYTHIYIYIYIYAYIYIYICVYIYIYVWTTMIYLPSFHIIPLLLVRELPLVRRHLSLQEVARTARFRHILGEQLKVGPTFETGETAWDLRQLSSDYTWILGLFIHLEISRVDASDGQWFQCVPANGEWTRLSCRDLVVTRFIYAGAGWNPIISWNVLVGFGVCFHHFDTMKGRRTFLSHQLWGCLMIEVITTSSGSSYG